MTSKEKAYDLVGKIYLILSNSYSEITMSLAKKIAIIQVDEIINGNFGDGYDHQFWECVKKEIEKL